METERPAGRKGGRAGHTGAGGPPPPGGKGPGSLWRRLVLDPAVTVQIQFLRYTAVGGAAFAVDFGSLFLLTEYGGLHYLLSAALAFCLGLATNYLLSVAWVFPRRTLSNRWMEFSLFALIGVVGLGLNEAVLWLLTEGAGLHYLLSKAGAAVVVFLWNFFARKLSLFR
ncbi:MAG: GtrA family protein [Acidobacteriota bacterium]